MRNGISQIGQEMPKEDLFARFTCNERGGLMSFTLSVVGNKSKALFALSVGGNISTYIIITPTTRFVIGVIIIMTLVLLLTLLFLFLLLILLF